MRVRTEVVTHINWHGDSVGSLPRAIVPPDERVW